VFVTSAGVFLICAGCLLLAFVAAVLVMVNP
jgi:hypothetical protein